MDRTQQHTTTNAHSTGHRSDRYERSDRDRDHPRDDRDRKRRRDSEERDRRHHDDDRDRREHFGRRGPAELNTLRDIRSALNYQNRLLEQFVGAENVRLGKTIVG